MALIFPCYHGCLEHPTGKVENSILIQNGFCSESVRTEKGRPHYPCSESCSEKMCLVRCSGCSWWSGERRVQGLRFVDEVEGWKWVGSSTFLRLSESEPHFALSG